MTDVNSAKIEIDKNTPNFCQKHSGCIFASGKSGSTPMTLIALPLERRGTKCLKMKDYPSLFLMNFFPSSPLISLIFMASNG